MTSLDLAQRRLREFATQARGVSPLYEHLATRAADDPEVAGLLTAAGEEHASGELLLAAAHRLVQAEPFHQLSNYYPSLGGTYGADESTWPLFRDFVLERSERVRKLVSSQVIQTNEVRRAALLYPAVAAAAKQAGAPIGLVEVATTAGLLLGLDQYSYRYQTPADSGQIVAGPTKAALGLHCALEPAPGAVLPKLPKTVKVAAKAGIGVAPADLTDEDAYAWLEACVWADQPERLRLFGVACGVLRKNPPRLVTGDPVADLAKAADPIEAPLVVISSGSGLDLVPALSALSRPVWWAAHEDGALSLIRVRDGDVERTTLATTETHGQRLVWH